MKNRTVEIHVNTPNGVKVLFRGQNYLQAISACSNYKLGRNGVTTYKGKQARIVDVISTKRKPFGWMPADEMGGNNAH